MIKIGILGDIGAGKSFIAKAFKYPVFDADQEVINIYKKNKFCFLKLKKRFPKTITQYPINKSELVEILFKNKKNIKEIGKIIHPFVNKKLEIFLKKNHNKKYVVLDIPLLLENKVVKSSIIYVFVESKKKDIRYHLKKRKNFNEKLYNIVRKNQLSLVIKKKKSKFIIKNNFKKKDVKKRVSQIKSKISNLC